MNHVHQIILNTNTGEVCNSSTLVIGSDVVIKKYGSFIRLTFIGSI
jgi:hypothetical protein